ncbi:MAG: hypothetical protein IKJ01_06095 [Lachnospiraceae bacterium]|nr:hypothetical protein [Lachnospiraceae bacterium]
MKNNFFRKSCYFAIGLLSIFVLTACGGTTNDESVNHSDTQQQIETQQEHNKEQQKERITVLSKENIYNMMDKALIVTYEYKYDKDGKQIEKTENYTDGRMYTIKTEYDANGNSISKFVSKDGIVDSIEKRVYNADGSSVISKYSCDESILLTQDELDKEGHTIKSVNTQSDSEIKYEYDTYDNVKKIETIAGDISSVTTYEYQYENNVPINAKMFLDGKQEGDIEYTYDENGKLVSVISYNLYKEDGTTVAEGEKGMETNRTEITYDANGNMVSKKESTMGIVLHEMEYITITK